METMIRNSLAVWIWPETAAELVSCWLEGIAGPRRAAISQGQGQEKGAGMQSNRSVVMAQHVINRASAANARALGRIAGGDLLDFAEWTQILERNLEVAATFGALTVAALPPVKVRRDQLKRAPLC